MFSNIFRTIIAKFLAAGLTFAVVFMASRALGPENYGTIGLIMVAVSMAMLFSSILGGASLVYYTSRLDPASLFSMSALWGIFISFVISFTMAWLDLYPQEYAVFVFCIAVVANVSQNLMFIILGRERILQQNIVTVLQVFLHFAMVSLFFHVFEWQNIKFYLISVLCSHTVAVIVGAVFCRNEIFPLSLRGARGYLKSVIEYGFWVQMSALIQIFNYRLSYYLVDIFLGRHMLGIYTLAVQLAESFWILPRSIATVQFSYISNRSDLKENALLTFKLMQMVVLSILVISIPVYFIPESWLTFVFGWDYEGIKPVLMLLIPAIVIFSGNIVVSHFFSGIGKVYYNTIVGAIGLVFTVITCLLLIPQFGLRGAAMAANLSYLAMFIAVMFCFITCSKTSLRDYFSSGMSFKKVLSTIRKMTSGKTEE